MPTRYLLPCTCGKTTPVEVGQAGETLTCACGNELKAPTLRGLRELTPATEEAPRKAGPGAPVDWSSGRGALFSLGLLVFVVSLAYGAYHLYIWSGIDVAQIEAHDEEHADDFVDQLSPVNMLEFWEETKNKTLQETLHPDHVSVKDIADYYLRRGQIGMLLTLISGAMVAFSLLGPKRPATAT
jgi:hypothetical protein